MTTVSVLVPFSSGCQWRAKAWDYVKARYEREHPGWELIEGHSPEPWSKGTAVRDAYERAVGDALIIADADSFTDPDVLREAVRQLDTFGWVVPHWMVLRLAQHGARRVYRGDEVHRGHTIRMPYVGLAGGGITVLRRSAYQTVGGIDPRFLTWGGEDLSFGWALETLVGDGLRLQGDLWHLWHPHPAPNHRGPPEAEALVARYRAARGDAVLMQQLVDEVRSFQEV